MFRTKEVGGIHKDSKVRGPGARANAIDLFRLRYALIAILHYITTFKHKKAGPALHASFVLSWTRTTKATTAKLLV